MVLKFPPTLRLEECGMGAALMSPSAWQPHGFPGIDFDFHGEPRRLAGVRKARGVRRTDEPAYEKSCGKPRTAEQTALKKNKSKT